MKQRSMDQAQDQEHVLLDDLFARIEEGELKDLNLIADVQEDFQRRPSPTRLNTDESRGSGSTSSTLRSVASPKATSCSPTRRCIIGFKMSEPKAARSAEKEHVDIRLYRVIYQVVSRK